MTRFVLAAILMVATSLMGSKVAAAASNPNLPQNQTEAASITLQPLSSETTTASVQIPIISGTA